MSEERRVRDPIHGFIRLSGDAAEIVETLVCQPLRGYSSDPVVRNASAWKDVANEIATGGIGVDAERVEDHPTLLRDLDSAPALRIFWLPVPFADLLSKSATTVARVG